MSKKLTIVFALGLFFLMRQVYSSNLSPEPLNTKKRSFGELINTEDKEGNEEPPNKKPCVILPLLSLDEGWQKLESYPYQKLEFASCETQDRYWNVIPFQFNRFNYLADDKRYINASLVEFDNCQQKFIQSQAPIMSTFADHWEMIWQSNATTTVMLTDFMERGIDKAHCYWPVEEGNPKEFSDNLKVRLLKREEHETECLHVSKFDFQIEKGLETKKHTLIHYKLWRDQSVVTETQILELYKFVKNIHSDKKCPIIVHCSAGIGRSGTFVSLYSLLSALEEGVIGDPYQQVLALRRQRAGSVQTKEQYALVYKAFHQFLSTKADKTE